MATSGEPRLIRRVWMVDVGLRDYEGHGFNYARSMVRQAWESGVAFRVLGFRGVRSEVLREIPVERVFRRHGSTGFLRCSLPYTRRLVNLYDCFRWNIEFHADLERALGGVGRDDLVFMPSLDDRHLPAWAWWLGGRSSAEAPETVLLLRYNPHRFSLPPFLLRRCFGMLERLVRTRRLRLVTDSDLLAREYAGFTSLPVEVFPVINTAEATALASSERGYPLRKSVRFVSLGEARDDKGFHLLVDAIRILRDRGLCRGMEFVLQGSRRSISRAMVDALLRLRRMDIRGLRVINEPLDAEAYYRLLEEADVVLVPYRRDFYFANTSGPFTEALAAAKPVVVTDGTWMSSQLSRFGGGVTFRDGDAEDLARAILEAGARLAELRERARATQPAWAAWHSPATFFRMLLGTRARRL